MLGIHNIALFVITSITLTLIPGPSTLYILGRSISQGRKAGVMSVLGIGTGSLCHTFAVSFGLSALLAASQLGFTIIKLAGAGYLIYLGIATLRGHKSLPNPEQAHFKPASPLRIYGQGTLTQVLNPKVSLFFIAILPQFATLNKAHSPLPFLLLGTLFVAMDTVWFLCVASGSAFVSSWLRSSARIQVILKWATGLLYIGLGLNLLRAKASSAT